MGLYTPEDAAKFVANAIRVAQRSGSLIEVREVTGNKVTLTINNRFHPDQASRFTITIEEDPGQ